MAGQSIEFECLVGYLLDNETCRWNYAVYGNNKGVVEGWWNGRSHNRAVNNVFKWVHECLQRDMTGSSIHTVYVGSKYNPADPSYSIPSPSPGLDHFIIDTQLPFTVAKYRACREGNYSEAAARWFNAHQRNDPGLE